MDCEDMSNPVGFVSSDEKLQEPHPSRELQYRMIREIQNRAEFDKVCDEAFVGFKDIVGKAYENYVRQQKLLDQDLESGSVPTGIQPPFMTQFDSSFVAIRANLLLELVNSPERRETV